MHAPTISTMESTAPTFVEVNIFGRHVHGFCLQRWRCV